MRTGKHVTEKLAKFLKDLGQSSVCLECVEELTQRSIILDKRIDATIIRLEAHLKDDENERT
jgi:hypothetical protein